MFGVAATLGNLKLLDVVFMSSVTINVTSIYFYLSIDVIYHGSLSVTFSPVDVPLRLHLAPWL